MAHTREDVANIKTTLILSLDRYIAVLKGNIAAAENCRRAVMMTTATIPDVEPLTLHETPESVAEKKHFVRGLAEKISNVTSAPTPGNGS